MKFAFTVCFGSFSSHIRVSFRFPLYPEYIEMDYILGINFKKQCLSLKNLWAEGAEYIC